MFAKPEAQLQLNVLNQTAVLNGNGAGHSFQQVVVTDLEFLGLKTHSAYRHEPGNGANDGVPPELSGRLVRETHEGVSIISESQKESRAERYKRIHAKAEALLAARSGRKGDGSRDASPEPPTTQSASVEQMLKPQESSDAPKPSSVASSDAAIHAAVARDAEQAQANQGARPGVAEQAWRDL